MLLCSLVVSAQQSYSELISFGDSLSDTGNLASATINLPPPYYENRISNGPVVIDYIAEHLGTVALASEVDGNNFAVAGGNIVGANVEDLGPQISRYLQRVNSLADANALYFVMMGGNDLRGLRAQTSPEITQMLVVQIVDKLITELTRLSNAGARQFFIANLANIGRIPETVQLEAVNPGISARATEYTQAFNALLASQLQVFRQQTGHTVIEFDGYTKFETILDSPETYGFTNSTDGCFQSSSFNYHPDCLFGVRFNEFVFFDNIHPTAATNQIFGEAMVNRLIEGVPSEPKPIPLAAILLLLLDD